ncbi:MAG: class I SAM-dependent methyltransferase [Candidatus Omnitrophica bacterium]|nr:class I SAM-dependent methyltransferase [Candidatus Omnitrophota bacterium]
MIKTMKKILSCMVLPHSCVMLKKDVAQARKDVLPLLEQNIPVLDIGCGQRPIVKGAIKLEFEACCGIDVSADAHCLPFLDNSIGFVWLGGVVEHLKNPRLCSKEIYRVLKDKGYVFVETPFFQIVHGAPYDFQRFTQLGLEEIFKEAGFNKIKSGIISGPSAAFAHVLRTYLAIFFSFNNDVLFHVCYYYIFGWFVLPVKLFDVFFTKYKQAQLMPFGIFYLGRK